MKKANKNVSRIIKSGTHIQTADNLLEHGKSSKGKESYRGLNRPGYVIDSNRRDEIAIVKITSNGDDLKIKNKFSPHIKTKDKNGNPLKIDGKVITYGKQKENITAKEANLIKKH